MGEPTVKYHLEKYDIILPLNHALPAIRNIYPLYSSNVGRIAKEVNKKYSELHIIDIGANVGDSAVIIRSYCSSPILCIEGCSEYINFLKDNTSQFTNIDIEESYVGNTTSQDTYAEIVEKGTARITKSNKNKITNLISFDAIFTKYPEFKHSKLWKIDTDGHDTSLIQQGLSSLRNFYPVIHFEYDPYFLKLSGNIDIEIFEILRGYGYRNALFYDNNGDYFAMVDICNDAMLEDLHQYQVGRKSDKYWDICVFHEEDTDICSSLRKSEIELFKKVRSDNINKVLWVRTDAIGDNLLASTELEHLRKYYGDAEITVLCQDRAEDIYTLCPYVNRIITFNRYEAINNEEYRKNILAQLKVLKPDISLNSVYSREPLTDYFTIECGAKERICIDCNLINITNELREKHNKFYFRIIPSDSKNGSMGKFVD